MKKNIAMASVELKDEEINAAVEVLKSGRLVHGPKAVEFEELFAQHVGARHAITVSSGTAALHLAYLALLEPGDEVLVPAFTHISTASMAVFSNSTPVFCDIDPDTFTIDIKEIKKKITPKTKAIAPVHLFGNSCEIDDILNIAKEYNLYVIWDAAQAHGTRYRGKDIGSFDDIVCYSFYPTKNMLTGEGGMITTNNTELYERLKLMKSHGQSKKYYHTMFGLNYRMSEVEAAIGIEQLKKLDSMIERRRANAKIYNTRLSEIDGIKIPLVKEYVEHSYHQYSVVLDEKIDRASLMGRLQEKGISTGVHYPRPVHKQPVFNSSEKLPVCEYLTEHIMSLPVHPGLEDEDIEYICSAIKEAL